MRSSIVAVAFVAFASAAVPAVAVADQPPPPPAGNPPPPPAANPAPPSVANPPPPSGTTSSAGMAPTLVSQSSAAPALKGLSVWGILPWAGIGAGARFMVPLGIAPVLRVPGLRDGFAVEVGADILHWSYAAGLVVGGYSWTEVLAVAGVMWSIWINEQIAFYPKAELGYAFGWFSDWQDTYGTRPTYGGFFWNGAAGILYKLQNGITLRAEGGYAGLRLGAGFLF